jgi:citrate-Mg2+:H+ or citrate-Ca2+:H+ symporter, CitMHS family
LTVLALMAFAMVATFMTLIMTRRMSAMIALIVVPLAFALAGGFAAQVGPMMLEGVRNLAPTGVMLMFAILYFAMMSDAGLFDPLVGAIVRFAHGDPVRVLVGTAVLTLLVSLDGDGSTTYMIVVAAMLPLYKRLRLEPLMLACVAMMASGVLNITPWGGPTARAASALHVDPGTIFVPMIPAMVAAALWVVFVAYRFGLRERRRLAARAAEPAAVATADVVEVAGDGVAAGAHAVGVRLAAAGHGAAGGTAVLALPERPPRPELVPAFTPEPPAPDPVGAAGADAALRRPKLLYVNAALTAALMVMLVLGVMPLPVLFMIAFAIAMMLNYPSVAEQKARVAAHAGNVFAVSGLIFAAGVFTGILSGTKMVDAMATSVIRVIPDALGPYLAVVTALLSIPFTFFISNDAFYFGVLPILAKAAAAYGIGTAEIGRASIVGQPVHLLSPLVPSTYLLVGLVGVELGDHQRYALKWTALTSLVLLAGGLVVGVIPLVGAAAGR